MDSSLKKIGRQIFGFLSSVQLAVLLLLSLAAILAVGTFLESSHDTQYAQHYVYKTWWFAGVLGLLGLNVLCAGLSRYPWKRHHTGFLTVHLGIITILMGSLITLYWGFEGQLIIPEGESRSRIFLNQSSLYFFEPSSGQLGELPAQFRFSPPTEKEPYGGKVLGDVLVRVNAFLPNSSMDIEVKEGKGELNPSLQVALNSPRANVKEWLFARDYQKQRVSLGPASLNFFESPKIHNFKQVLNNEGLRGPVLWISGQWIPLKGNLGKKFSAGRSKIVIKNFFPDGVVYQGQLVNRQSKIHNPVALVGVTRNGQEEEYAVFAKYSQLPPLKITSPTSAIQHDNKKDLTIEDLRLFYFPRELGKQPNELAMAKLDSGVVVYALSHGGTWQSPKKIRLKEPVNTGWMDFTFSISQALNHAEVKKKYRKVNVPKGKEGPPPAIRIQIAQETAFEDFWLGRGQSEDITLGDRTYKVAYALKSAPLSFKLKLKKFFMGKYEGTENPSKYESEVTLIDDGQGIRQDHLIAMNQPLKHGKFKFFQASYQLNPDGPDWTVLSVAFDPGIWVKYVGSIILILGIIIIFYFRKAYMRKPAKSKVAKDVPHPSKLGPLPTETI